MSFLCDVTSTIEPDVFNKQNRSYSHRWQSRPSNKSFLATSPDCSFLRRRLAAVTSQKASFTFLKLCIDRVDASYVSAGWFSSVMGADVVAGWASPASRRIIISIPAWDFSDLTRFLHRGHIFSCQTSLKCSFFFGVLLIREAPAVQFHQTVFLYLLSLQQLFSQSWGKPSAEVQSPRYIFHPTAEKCHFCRLVTADN